MPDLLTSYRLRVEASAVMLSLALYVGRSINEPLPKIFSNTSKYVIGIMNLPLVGSAAHESSETLELSKGTHYVVFGVQPQLVFGAEPPSAISVKYTITIAGRTMTISAGFSQENYYAYVVLKVTDTGITVVDSGNIMPGQKPYIEVTGSGGSVTDLLGGLTGSIGDMFTNIMGIMMPMMLMMMMMQMMTGMMSALAGAFVR